MTTFFFSKKKTCILNMSVASVKTSDCIRTVVRSCHPLLDEPRKTAKFEKTRICQKYLFHVEKRHAYLQYVWNICTNFQTFQIFKRAH